MEIILLVKQLEEQIEAKMTAIDRLGKECKAMHLRNSADEGIQQLYIEMATIFHDLRPVEKTVREKYPKCAKLFDLCIALYAEKLLCDEKVKLMNEMRIKYESTEGSSHADRTVDRP